MMKTSIKTIGLLAAQIPGIKMNTQTTRAIVGAVVAMSLMANAVMAQQAGAGKPQSKPSETRDPVVPARWPAEKATTWYAKQPWLVGCNFIPSTAINQLEMWQADTFDPVTIDRELGWASGMGMNSVRVYLHHLLWQQDSEGFLKRMDQFLGIADKHHIITLFVLCDSVWNPHPKLGKQPEPKPRVHNSGWVQSPHIEVLRDELQHDSLAPYFKGVISRFKDDSRVLGWDLYNEPGNDGEPDRMTTLEKEAKCLLLLTKMFRWARQVNPSQPLTTGLWSTKEWVGPQATALNRFIVANSDVLSFHIYDRIDKTRGRVDSLKPLGRPLLCTEYMSREAGSLFEDHLPYFKQHKIGAYNWGFVAGKIQTQYPWSSWSKTFTAEPEVWSHDILRPDGTPFRQAEVDLFKSLTAGNHPGTAQPSDLPAPVRFIENLAAGKNQTVVTMGTSLTKGGNWVPQMKDLLEQKYPNLAKVVNLGRDASSTAAPKGRCGLDMVKAVVAAKPDAVFIEYGMNDCYLRYEITPAQSAKNLNTIIDTILAANPQTEIILQTMNSCKDYPEKNPPWLHASNRPKLADYYQIQRDIARKRNLRLIDHYPAWLAVMNNDPARFDKLVPDRIHPNAEGAREIIMPTLIKELGL